MEKAAKGDQVINTSSQLNMDSADAAKIDYAKACDGTTSVTLEEATTQNVLSFSISQRTVHEVKDVPYKLCFGPQGLETLLMDVLVPDPIEGDPAEFPLIVSVPGGGFMYAHPEHNLSKRMRMAQAGYVVASVHVRCVPDIVFPSPLEDAKAAIRFLRAHAADYHIDKAKVGAIGDSSGGYFASMLGVTSDIKAFDVGDNLEESSAVSAVVALYPVCDLTIIGSGLGEKIVQIHHSPSATEGMLVNGAAFPPNPGGGVFDDLSKTAITSPYAYIGKDTPPFLIFHGNRDKTVSPVGSMVLHKRLAEAGVHSERFVVDGAPHGGPKFDQPEVMDRVIAFFDKFVKNA